MSAQKFPVSVFPKFIREYINALNKTLNFHPDFTSAAILFAVSTICGNKYKLRVKNGWETPPIFWLACVGFPGTIKSHPVRTILKPLHDIDRESKKEYDEQMRHWNPEAKPREPKPRFKQMLISDYTLEALHSIHDINKRGIGLYKDELKGFLNDMNKYRKGSDEEFWLESFNNGSYIVNRVTKEPIMITDICINLIGTIQHDVLSKVVQEYAGNGLIDRFLYTTPEDTVFTINNNELPDHHHETWNEYLNKLHRSIQYIDHDCTEVLPLERDAFEEYQRIDQRFVDIQNSEDTAQEVKNYLSKMKTYVPRFALIIAIIHAVDKKTKIKVTYNHMAYAGLMADYFIEAAKSTFNFNKDQQEIKEIVQSMRSLTRNEKILKLYEKDFMQTEIARFFNVSKQFVSKVVNQ